MRSRHVVILYSPKQLPDKDLLICRESFGVSKWRGGTARPSFVIELMLTPNFMKSDELVQKMNLGTQTDTNGIV